METKIGNKKKHNFKHSNTIIVNFEFVNGVNKQLFIKELSYMIPDTANIGHFIFKPPYPEEELNKAAKFQNDYSSKNINGLKWNDGTLEFIEEIGYIFYLTDKFKFEYHDWRVNFLTTLLKNIIPSSKYSREEVMKEFINQIKLKLSNNKIYVLLFIFTHFVLNEIPLKTSFDFIHKMRAQLK